MQAWMPYFSSTWSRDGRLSLCSVLARGQYAFCTQLACRGSFCVSLLVRGLGGWRCSYRSLRARRPVCLITHYGLSNPWLRPGCLPVFAAADRLLCN